MGNRKEILFTSINNNNTFFNTLFALDRITIQTDFQGLLPQLLNQTCTPKVFCTQNYNSLLETVAIFDLDYLSSMDKVIVRSFEKSKVRDNDFLASHSYVISVHFTYILSSFHNIIFLAVASYSKFPQILDRNLA